MLPHSPFPGYPTETYFWQGWQMNSQKVSEMQKVWAQGSWIKGSHGVRYSHKIRLEVEDQGACIEQRRAQTTWIQCLHQTSSVVNAREGGVWPGLWQMVTALWKTSKGNASTGLIYTYLRCTPSSGFGQTSSCCRCTVSDQKVNAAKHLLLSLALLF